VPEPSPVVAPGSSQTAPHRGEAHEQRERTSRVVKQAWAAGGIFTAGVLLLLAGGWQVVAGISAILKDTVFVVGVDYVWKLDLTTWGWIHLLLGVGLFAVGIFILRGAAWAAVTGIVLAGLSALANFLWLPYQPLWAILVIALDVLIIWALATRRESIHLLDT
jgi:hypothetical protein